MSDGVGRVAFAKETSSKTSVDRKLAVKDLHSDAVRVAEVSRRVDAGHSADPEHAIEAILTSQNGAEPGAGLRERVEGFVV